MCFFSESGFASTSTFLERPFGPLSGRKILPSLFLILIEASYKYHVAIEMAKLSEACLAVLWIDDTRIILPDHIHASHRRLIDIASTGITRIRKQFG